MVRWALAIGRLRSDLEPAVLPDAPGADRRERPRASVLQEIATSGRAVDDYLSGCDNAATVAERRGLR